MEPKFCEDQVGEGGLPEVGEKRVGQDQAIDGEEGEELVQSGSDADQFGGNW